MSNKRKRAQLDAKRAAKKAAEAKAVRAELRQQGRLVGGTVLPGSVIGADLSQQVPNNSYGGRPLYYQDQPFRCVDCDVEQVWTAADQKWYYEVVKGSLYGRAVRCLPCRRSRKSRAPQNRARSG